MRRNVLLPLIVLLSGCNGIKSNVNYTETHSNKQKMPQSVDKKTKQSLLNSPIEHCYLDSSVKLLLPEELLKYMNSAIKNNKQIIEQQHELLMEHEQYNMVKSAFMPVITAEGSLSNSGTVYSKNKEDITQDEENTLSKTEIRSPAIKLEARYNLFKGGADIAQLKQVNKGIKAKWKAYDALVQKVLQETAQYYFEIISKQKEIENIQALLKARKDSLRIIKDMEKAGNAKEVDVGQALAGYYEAEAKLSKAKAEENIYRAALEEHTGMPCTIKLSSDNSLFNKKFTVDEASHIATMHNPQIISATAQYEAAKYGLNASTSEFAPSIDLVTGITHKGVHEKNYPEYSRDKKNLLNEKQLIQTYPEVRLVGTLPIFNGGSSIAKRRKASESVTKAKVTKERILNEVRKEIIKTLELETAADENIVSSKKAIEVQSLVLKATKEEYNAGTKMTSDVLESQQKLFDAQLALTSAIKEKYIQQCNLMALLGLFNPKKLKLKETFDYNVEFNKQARRIRPTYADLGVE